MSEVQLPNGWEWKKLGEIISNAQVGIVKSNSEQNSTKNGVPYIKMNNIDLNGSTNIGSLVYVEASTDEIEKYALQNGDILFNTRNSFELVGKTGIVRNSIPFALYNNNLLRLRFNKGIQSAYVNYQMISPAFRKELTKGKKATTNICAIYQKDLLALNILVPPLSVQNQIVARIEELFSELDAGVQELQTALKRLKTYRQTVLHHYLNNLDWEQRKLGEISSVYVGATPSRKIADYWNGNVNWVSSGEVAFRDIRNTKEKITELGLSKTSTTVHPVGTILLAMIGEGKTRGQAAILQTNAAHNQNTAAIRPNIDLLTTKFLYYHLMMSYNDNRRIGSGNNQQALNKSRVQEMIVRLPELTIQSQIVLEIEARLSEVDALEATIRQELARSENLRQSILKRAFEGKLIPAATIEETTESELAGVSEPTRPIYDSSGDQLSLF